MGEYRSQCGFCGASVGEISERTEEKVNTIYDCPRCRNNYCDQCRYEKQIDAKKVQLC